MFETLTGQLKANQNCEASALLLVNALIARIASAGTNPDEVRALVNGLQAEKNQLARAVVEGTPGDQRPKIVDPNDPKAVAAAAEADKKLQEQSAKEAAALRDAEAAEAAKLAEPTV